MPLSERKISCEWVANAAKSKQSVKKRQEVKICVAEKSVPADVCKGDRKDFRFKEPQVDKTRKRSEGMQKADKCTQTVSPVKIQLDRLYHSSLKAQSSSHAFGDSFADEDEVRNCLLIKLSKELKALCEPQLRSSSDPSESIDKATEPWHRVPTCCKK